MGYDPVSGILTWLGHPDFPTNLLHLVGTPAGSVQPDGYRTIDLAGYGYPAHHLAWVHYYGVWADLIDHRDGLRDRNSIDNLREADYSQNRANAKRQSNNTSGFKGVSWEARRGMFKASISFRKRRKTLGYRNTAEAAYQLYQEAAVSIHGDFART